MNKLILFVFSFSLLSCAGHSGSRSDIRSKGESLLSNGVLYYQKDNFPAAQQNFYRALVHYQSIDHAKRVQLARINYTESLLALNDFDAAEEQLALLKTNNEKGKTASLLEDRVVMLEVKLLFQKQQYPEALVVIEPLLVQIEQQESNKKRLDLLATAARLEVLNAEKSTNQWEARYRELLLEEKNKQPKYTVILKRIDAVIATQKKQYNDALKLLHGALVYYKEQANRRAIATCLEEIADIEFKQQHYPQAIDYLKKALSIRIWLKDQYHIEEIQKKIRQVNNLS